MPGRQAKVVSRHMLVRMLARARRSKHPERDRVIILLSAKARLRACEIARLEWSMVLDGRGKVGSTFSLHDRVAKKRSGRTIPLHPDLRRALITLHEVCGGSGPVICSLRGGA